MTGESVLSPGCEIGKEYHFVLRGRHNGMTGGYDLEAFIYELEKVSSERE